MGVVPDEESQSPTCNIFSKDYRPKRSNYSDNIARCSANLRLNYIDGAPLPI